MIKNYLKIALRQLRKQRLYAAIKIGGFALGIAACLLIALYIRDETSFDKSYPDTNRIYRVVGFYNHDGKVEKARIGLRRCQKRSNLTFLRWNFRGGSWLIP